MFDTWFTNMPGNSSEYLAPIHETYMLGGYYTMDLNDQVRAIALNTMYWEDENDESYDGDEMQQQM